MHDHDHQHARTPGAGWLLFMALILGGLMLVCIGLPALLFLALRPIPATIPAAPVATAIQPGPTTAKREVVNDEDGRYPTKDAKAKEPQP